MAAICGAGPDRFIDFVAINTDVQALAASQADVRVQIGDGEARGDGADGDARLQRRIGGRGGRVWWSRGWRH